MVRRIFAIVLIVLGLGTIGAAIASGTIWRPDDRVTLTLPTTPDVPLVLTAPGVLSAVDNDVDVRIVGATADTPVMLAMARERDVLAWVGDAPHWEITGLLDWETLSYTDSRDEGGSDPTPTDGTATPSGDGTATESASPSESPSAEVSESPTADASETPTDETEPAETVPNPSGSDLWVEELTGTGELEYSWTAIPGRWVMLVASDGTEPAPQVELTWDRPVETPFVRPGIILGSVVLLLGLGLLVLQILADLEKRRARRRTAAAASTGETPAIVSTDENRPLTRREIRLAEEARRRGDTSRTAQSAPEPVTETIPALPAEGEETPSAATPAEATADEAGELDAWVRSGAASPLLHEGERTTPPDLDVAEEAQDDGESQDEAAPPSSDEQPARAPWWRRRSARSSGEDVAEDAPDEPETPPAVASEPDESPVERSGDTDEIPAMETEPENDPQEWGASWRQTWGLGADPEAESKEGDR